MNKGRHSRHSRCEQKSKTSHVPDTLGRPDNSPPCTASTPLLCSASLPPEPLPVLLYDSVCGTVVSSFTRPSAAAATIFTRGMLLVRRTKGTLRPWYPGRLCIPLEVNGEYVRLNWLHGTKRGAIVLGKWRSGETIRVSRRGVTG